MAKVRFGLSLVVVMLIGFVLMVLPPVHAQVDMGTRVNTLETAVFGGYKVDTSVPLSNISAALTLGAPGLVNVGSRTYASTVFNQLLFPGGSSGDALCPNGGSTGPSCTPGVNGMEFRGPVAFGNEGSINGQYNGSGSVQNVDTIAVQIRNVFTNTLTHAIGLSNTAIWAPSASVPSKILSVFDTLGAVVLKSSRTISEMDGYSSTLETIGGDGTGTVPIVNGFKAASFTNGDSSVVSAIRGFYAQNQGVSGVPVSYGLYLDNQTGSTTNYSFYSAGGIGYHAGPFAFGSTMVGNSSASGVGYSTGAGGAVSQLTSKSTTVTLNAPSGQITMSNAALNGGATVDFTLADSAIGANDVLVVNIKSGASTASYLLNVIAVVGGGAVIELRNYTGGTLSESVVLQFAVIKGSTN